MFHLHKRNDDLPAKKQLLPLLLKNRQKSRPPKKLKSHRWKKLEQWLSRQRSVIYIINSSDLINPVAVHEFIPRHYLSIIYFDNAYFFLTKSLPHNKSLLFMVHSKHVQPPTIPVSTSCPTTSIFLQADTQSSTLLSQNAWTISVCPSSPHRLYTLNSQNILQFSIDYHLNLLIIYLPTAWTIA